MVTSERGAPVSQTVVTLASLGLAATTNEGGTYRLFVPSERVVERPDSLRVTRLGFRPTTVPFLLRTGEIRADVSLTSQVVRLDQIVVTGTAGSVARSAETSDRIVMTPGRWGSGTASTGPRVSRASGAAHTIPARRSHTSRPLSVSRGDTDQSFCTQSGNVVGRDRSLRRATFHEAFQPTEVVSIGTVAARRRRVVASLVGPVI